MTPSPPLENVHRNGTHFYRQCDIAEKLHSKIHRKQSLVMSSVPVINCQESNSNARIPLSLMYFDLHLTCSTYALKLLYYLCAITTGLQQNRPLWLIEISLITWDWDGSFQGHSVKEVSLNCFKTSSMQLRAALGNPCNLHNSHNKHDADNENMMIYRRRRRTRKSLYKL